MQEKNNRQKGIFICGAGLMQVPVVRIAKEMGLNTVCADGNPDAPAALLCDRFCHIDLKDREAIGDAVAASASKGEIHGVMTAATDFSATVAWAAEKAGLPGIPWQTALDASDKGRMRDVFKRTGVPSPAFRVIASKDGLSGAQDLSWPLVVKPVDNMGARGIRLACTPAELETAAADAFPYSRSGKVIIEEYIQGPEFSIDALVYQGKITICGIADRHIFFPPYFIEMGHTIPSAFPEKTIARLIETFRMGVKALGINNGAAKGDIKLSRKGPVIGEIAARLSGGYMSGWTFPYSSGVDAARGAINIALGLDPGNLEPVFSAVSAERAWISVPGKISGIRGLREAGHISYVKDVLPRVGPGERVVFPRNNVEKCGNIIAAAPERSAAVQAAEQAVRKIFIQLEAGDSETADFLFFDSSYPSAFSPDSGEFPGPEALKKTAAPISFGADMKFSPVFPDRVNTAKFMKKSAVLKDWHGRTLPGALEELFGGPYYRKDGGIPLGGVFWKAFLKGSIQGADWLARTLLSAGSADEFMEMVNRWQ